MFSSIRGRLIFTYLLLFLVVMLFINSFLLNMLEHYYLSNQKEFLLQAGRLVAEFSQTYLGEEASYVILSNLAEDFSRQFGARVLIVNENNVVVGDSVRVRGLIGTTLEREEIRRAREEGQGDSIQQSLETGHWVMQVSVPITREGRTLGAVFLSYSLNSVYQVLSDIRNILLSTMALALLVVGLLGVILARKISLPISALIGATGEMAQGNFDQKIKVNNRDETGMLASQFNLMAARLREMTGQLQEKIRDVSAEKNKLNAILNNMADGVIAVDSQGRLMMANPVAEKMFEFQEAENLEQSLKEIDADKFSKLDNFFLEVWRDKKELSGELPLGPGFIRFTCSPLLSDNQDFIGTVAVLRDITAQRKLEKMQKEFVADVSHELRTPLSSVNLLVKNMLEYDLAKDEGREFLKDIDGEIERLSLLVQDILDLTRMDTLEEKVHREKVNVKEVIEGVMLKMLPRANRIQVLLTWDIPQLPQLKIDREQLKRVLINLVDNAINYTPEGGWIKVEAAQQGQGVRFMVRDTGPGIPEEDQPRVFERFYRVDKTRSREMGGTGLGLAICQEIITAHGGKIWVESKEGQGTAMFFTLPG